MAKLCRCSLFQPLSGFLIALLLAPPIFPSTLTSFIFPSDEKHFQDAATAAFHCINGVFRMMFSGSILPQIKAFSNVQKSKFGLIRPCSLLY